MFNATHYLFCEVPNYTFDTYVRPSDEICHFFILIVIFKLWDQGHNPFIYKMEPHKFLLTLDWFFIFKIIHIFNLKNLSNSMLQLV